MIMEGNNTAPFEVGETVIAVMSGVHIVKGQEYIIQGLKKLCCKWLVDVGVNVPYDTQFRCIDCKREFDAKEGGIWWLTHKMFARIKRISAELEISKEVFDSFPKTTKEGLDVVVKPQTVTNLHLQLLESIDEMIELLPSLPEDEQDYYTVKIRGMIEKANGLIQC